MIRILWLLAALFPLAAAEFTLEGQFHPTTAGQDRLLWENPRYSARPQFSSYRKDETATGALRTAPFRAPHDLHFFEAGFPTVAGIRIYLEDTKTLRTLDLHSRSNPAMIWRERVWELPAAWRGARVSLIVEDRSVADNGWIAVTLPEPGRDSFFHSLLRASFRPIFLIFDAALFLLPGWWLALLVLRRGGLIEGFRCIVLVLTGSALSAYAVFWCYFLSPVAGKAAAVGIIGSSGMGIAWLLRRGSAVLSGSPREAMQCFAVVTLAAIFYCGTGFLYYSDDEPTDVARSRFFAYNLPSDNILPHLMAERLYNGKLDPQVRMGEWHSSDRPPLQSAAVLLEFLSWHVLSPALHYQLFCVWLQCTWIAGVWVLMRAASMNGRAVAIVIGFCLFSGFCWTNSFFVWPKLLAAAFCLMCLACFPLIRGRGSRWNLLDATLAGATAGLSLLSHAGCVFTFAAFLLIVLARRAYPVKWHLAAALGMLMVLLLPWFAYQRFYDPPGDALMKLHLADTVDENKPLGETLRAAYARLTFQAFVKSKAENVEALFWHRDENPGLRPLAKVLDRFLALSFFVTVATLGILNAGFVARFFSRRDQAERFADLLIGTALLSTIVWCVLMFKGGATWVHQGSYAQVLLLFTGLSIYLINSWPRFTYWLLGAQMMLLFPLFVFAQPVVEALPNAAWDAPLDPGMLVISVVALAALFYTSLLVRDLH